MHYLANHLQNALDFESHSKEFLQKAILREHCPCLVQPIRCKVSNKRICNETVDVQKVEENTKVKIVWRMTGSGNIHFLAYSSRGRHVVPIWGPEEHGGSNWHRPGDEWGTSFNFPVSGCWDIHVMRGNAVGDVWLGVH